MVLEGTLVGPKATSPTTVVRETRTEMRDQLRPVPASLPHMHVDRGESARAGMPREVFGIGVLGVFFGRKTLFELTYSPAARDPKNDTQHIKTCQQFAMILVTGGVAIPGAGCPCEKMCGQHEVPWHRRGDFYAQKGALHPAKMRKIPPSQ
jgi:hypothetical protein